MRKPVPPRLLKKYARKLFDEELCKLRWGESYNNPPVNWTVCLECDERCPVIAVGFDPLAAMEVMVFACHKMWMAHPEHPKQRNFWRWMRGERHSICQPEPAYGSEMIVEAWP